MNRPLDQALRPLLQRVGVGQVEVARQVDEQEGREEPEQHDRRPWHHEARGRGDERDQEEDREDVGERDRPREVPMDLLEGDAEESGEEEEARDPSHVTSSSTRANSSTRVRRETLSRHSSLPRAPALVQRAQRADHAVDVVGRDDDARAGFADQLGCGAVRRHDGKDRPLRGEIFEDLAAQHALAAPACLRDQQQQRLRVALQLERPPARRVRNQLEPVAEVELVGPLAVGRAEVAEEAHDDVVEARLLHRSQERARVALAEERARVRDAEALRRDVLDPDEVVEVGAVRDRHDRSTRSALAHFVGDRLRHGDDRVGAACDEPRDGVLALLLRTHDQPFRVAVRVRDDRVAQVGHPRHAGGALHRSADEVHRRRRRRRDDHVDALALHDAERGRDRGQVPAHVLVGDEQPPPGELRLLGEALEPLRPVQLLRRLAALRPHVARAVHPGERRRHQLVVAVDPLRIVGREHVRLDPELRQVRGELQRPLHAAAARGREVHRHEEHLHREGR